MLRGTKELSDNSLGVIYYKQEIVYFLWSSQEKSFLISFFSPTGGYNINDVMFYWTRGNESVSGLDTLQLAQYTVEDHYTSVSEAVYETGNNDFQTHRLM